MNFKDIYSVMNYNLAKSDCWELSTSEYQKLYDKELQNYILSKLNEEHINIHGSLDTYSLFKILCATIPEEKRFEVLSPFIHLLLLTSGNIQGYSINWFIDEETDKPIAEFDQNNKWDSLTTSSKQDMSYLFRFTYDLFTNNVLHHTANTRK